MSIVIKGKTSCFKSNEKFESFKNELAKCATEEDYKKIKPDEYLKEGFAYTMKKTQTKLYVNLMTEKEARRAELRMRLHNRIDHMKNGQKRFNQKMKEERGYVDQRVFKKYVKAVRVGGNRVIAPSDIMNDVQKYGQMCCMLANPAFCKDKVLCDYYKSMKEHLGLPDFSLPDMKAEQHPSVEADKKAQADLNNEQDTEEEDEPNPVAKVKFAEPVEEVIETSKEDNTETSKEDNTETRKVETVDDNAVVEEHKLPKEEHICNGKCC